MEGRIISNEKNALDRAIIIVLKTNLQVFGTIGPNYRRFGCQLIWLYDFCSDNANVKMQILV